MKSIESPVALITGGARRIGAAIAQHLHDQGYTVLIHYQRSATEAETLMTQLNTTRRDSAFILQADLSQLEAIKQLGQQITGITPHINVVVNNASAFYQTAIDSANESQWNHLIDTNLKGPYFLTQTLLPLLQQDTSIINITDTHAYNPLADYSIYTVSKSGLQTLTKSLAKELGPKIRVNAIAPGPTLWPEGSNELDIKAQQKVLDKTALKRLADPCDIAKTVSFLIDNPSITGTTITVDAGRALF